MIYKVAVIGAGQLGSRHIQGLLSAKLNLSLEVVEPNKRSIELTSNRVSELKYCSNISRISYFDDLSKLSDELDLVIIATNADIRFSIVKNLLESKVVKNLILEKVLFQKTEDYYDCEKILREENTKCWVNHPRRCFPFYKKLKDKLENVSYMNISISGGAWGLACNGLHFLDLISYLSEETDVEIDTKFLDNEIINTKRKGFIELTGCLNGRLNNTTFSITSLKNKSPIQISITSDEVNICIDEAEGWFGIKDENLLCDNEKIIYFQSELSNILVEDILNKEKCDLPTYQEAMKLHLVFIKNLISFINDRRVEKINYCPIT